MLKRKISETLKEWKEQPNHSPLVIMGIRQCGKTYISQLFAEENYKHVVYINFIKQKRRKSHSLTASTSADLPNNASMCLRL